MATEKKTVGNDEELGEKKQGPSDWWSLPEDVKVDILCRLPEKPLIASKRVSKDWYFLINYACIPRLSPPSPSVPICGVFGPPFTSDPSKSSSLVFSPHGLYHSLFYNRRMMHIPDPVGSYLDSLPFISTTKNLLDCCNGFLLLSNTDSEPVRYFVGNPATGQTIPIPVNPIHHDNVDSSLLFDPTESLEYKIVRFVHSVGKVAIKCVDVFWSRRGEWVEHKLPLELEVPGIGWLKSSVYLDGVLYKISGGGCLICLNVKANADLGNLNAWSTIQLPNQQNKEYVGSIGASEGHLYYFSRDVSDFLFWTLDKGGQWIIKYSISIYSLRHSSLGGYYCSVLGDKVWSTIQPCVLLPSSDETILLETSWFLVTYEFKDASYNWYDIKMRGCETRRLGESFPYSRSWLFSTVSSIDIANNLVHSVLELLVKDGRGDRSEE